VHDVLLERQAAVSVYTQITLEGMSDVFQNVNSGVPLNGQELRNAYSTPWAEYVRSIADEVSSLLAKMFKDHRFRLCGEEWIANCLDMTIQGVSVNPILDEVTFSGVTQTTKNKLYKGDFLDSKGQNFYFDKFVEMMDFISSMIAEEILEEKILTRASAVQNLYWMLCNGIETYDQAVTAVELHNDAYADKSRTFACGEDDKTFRECCNGMSAENLSVRYVILKEIVDEVSNRNTSNFSSLNQHFNTVP
jgi:hypothetical protein